MTTKILKPTTFPKAPLWHYLALGLGAFAFLSTIQSYRTFGKIPDANEIPAEPQEKTPDLNNF